jgi:hypothetical protein
LLLLSQGGELAVMDIQFQDVEGEGERHQPQPLQGNNNTYQVTLDLDDGLLDRIYTVPPNFDVLRSHQQPHK